MEHEEKTSSLSVTAISAPAREHSQRQSPDGDTSTSVRFLTKSQVMAAVAVSSTGLWELMVKADFPHPRVLHGNPNSINGRSYWIASEVEAWMLSRPRRVLKKIEADN